MKYWLVKQEPDSYGWDDFVREGRTAWTGVRNFQARNNLKAMRAGDLVLFYHSVSEKRIVGIARVERENYADPTAKEGDWVCVDLAPVKALAEPVTLETMRSDESLKDLLLLRQSRLSVVPVAGDEFKHILKLGKTSLR